MLFERRRRGDRLLLVSADTTGEHKDMRSGWINKLLKCSNADADAAELLCML